MTVEELKILITAQIDKFNKQTKEVNKKINDIDKNAQKAQKSINKIFNQSFSNTKFGRQLQETKDGINSIISVAVDTRDKIEQTFSKPITVATPVINDIKANFGMEGMNNVREAVKQVNASISSMQEKLNTIKTAVPEEEFKFFENSAKRTINSVKNSIEELNVRWEQAFSNNDKKNILDNFKKEVQRTIEQTNKLLDANVPDLSVEGLKNKLNILKQTLNEQKSTLKQSQSDWKSLQNEYNRTQKEIDSLIASMKKLNAEKNERYGSMLELVWKNGTTMEDAYAAFPDLKAYDDQLSKQQAKLDDLLIKHEQQNGKIKEAKKLIEETNRKIGRTSEYIQKTTDALTNAKRQAKEMNNALSATRKQSSFIARAFKSMLLFTALNRVISMVTQNIKECYDILMKFDAKNNNLWNYNNTISDLTTSFKGLSATIAVTVANIINTAAPVIEFILNGLTNVLDYINMITAGLQGKTEYASFNKDYWKNYLDGVKEAKEETKRFLASFDELNVIPSNLNIGEIWKKPSSSDDELYIKKAVDKEAVERAKLALFVTALGATLAAVNKLINGFKQKDKALDTQTGKTKKETSAVSALAKQFGLASLGVLGFAGVLGSIREKFPSWEKEGQRVYALNPALESVSNQATVTQKSIQELQTQLGLLTAPHLELGINTNPMRNGLAEANILMSQYGNSLVGTSQAVGTQIGNGIAQGILSSIPTIASVFATQQQMLMQHALSLNTITMGINLLPKIPETVAKLLEFVNSTKQTISDYVTSTNESTSKIELLPQSKIADTNANINTFKENSIINFSEFRDRVAGIAGETSNGLLNAFNSGLQAIDSNIIAFENNANANMAKGANGMLQTSGQLQSPMVSLFNNIFQSISDSWKKFVNGMGGQSSTDSAFKTPSFSLPSIGTGGLGLSPITLIPALANGGVLTTPTTVLAGEYSGAKQNPEIVTPQNLMKETMEEANNSVVNAVMAMGSMITKAVQDKDTDIYLDNAKVSRKISQEQKKQTKNKGTNLVIV